MPGEVVIRKKQPKAHVLCLDVDGIEVDEHGNVGFFSQFCSISSYRSNVVVVMLYYTLTDICSRVKRF